MPIIDYDSIVGNLISDQSQGQQVGQKRKIDYATISKNLMSDPISVKPLRAKDVLQGAENQFIEPDIEGFIKSGGSISEEAKDLAKAKGLDYEKMRVDGKLSPRQIIDTITKEGVEIDKNLILQKAPPPPPKGFVEGMKEDWPQTLGATIGGVTALASGVGTLPTIAAAGLGGAAGKGYQQVGEQLAGYERAPKTSFDAIGQILKAGTTEAAYEAGGALLIGAGAKVLKPFAKKVTPEGLQALNDLNKYMPKEPRYLEKWRPPQTKIGKKVAKPSLPPASIVESKGMDVLHNIAEASFFGNKLGTREIERGVAINAMADDLGTAFGKVVSPDDLGRAISEAATAGLTHYRKAYTTPMYNMVSEIAGETPIDVTVLKKSIAKEFDALPEVGGIEAESMGDALIEYVMARPDVMSFDMARKMRSRFRTIKEKFQITDKNAPTIGIAKKLEAVLNKEIDKTLGKTNPYAQRIWRNTNEIYRAGSQKFNNQFVRSLVKQANPDLGGKPEKVLGMIFKDKGVTGLNQVKKIAGKDLWGDMKTWHIGAMMEKSKNNNGEIIGDKLFNALFSEKPTTGMGTNAMKIIYEPEQLKGIKKLINVLKVVQKKRDNTGKIFIQLTQAGVIGSALMKRGPAIMTAAAFFGTIGRLSKLMTSPTGVKLLTTGLVDIDRYGSIPASMLLRMNKTLDKIDDKTIKSKRLQKFQKRWEDMDTFKLPSPYSTIKGATR